MPSSRPPPNPAQSPQVDDATLVQRGTNVMTANVGKEIVMMDVLNGRYLGVNDIGGDIWRRLETPRRFGELIDGLAADYQGDRAVIAADVRKLLQEMAVYDVVKLG